MKHTTHNTARLMAKLAEAEDTLTTARRDENRATTRAQRATTRARAARADLAAARKNLRTAQRTGKGIAAATRRVTTRENRLANLVDAARHAQADATTARRATRTAARRVDNLAHRAATAAARTVENITHRLGETSLAPAPETDRTLPADQLPTIEDIEAHAARFAELDRESKNLAKLAEAEKTWLRTLPTGTYGRAVITRAPGRSVLDGAQVALDYTARGEIPPRKTTRATFKCDATALLEGAARTPVQLAA